MRFVNLWHFFSFQCFFLEPDLVFRWIDFKLLAFLTLRLQTFSNRHISVSPRYCGGITIILLNSINAENVNENYINEIFEVFKDSGNRYYFSVTLEKILLLLQENPWKNYFIFFNIKFFFFFFFNFFSFFFFRTLFQNCEMGRLNGWTYDFLCYTLRTLELEILFRERMLEKK